MQKQPIHKNIRITKHAMLRLKERVVSHTGFPSWQDLVKAARYKGRGEENMTDAEYEWYLIHIKRLYQSFQVRILNGFAFLFMGNKGHARTLVTVIEVM
ncbi:MAG: hypothetical protein U0L88_05155 [Acutalibacteraceae bacterium]|nr:hypothetical protein [Acutalibacteraceae bacterium]